MSLDAINVSLEIFWFVIIAGAAVGSIFLATIAIVDGINTLVARFK